MTFTLKIKIEILNQEYSKIQAYDFIFGLIITSAVKIKANHYLIKINNHIISASIIDMFEQLKLSYEKSQINKNFIVLKNFNPNQTIRYPANFFSGIFVGGGSISDPQSTSYHLELQFFDSDFLSKVRKMLNKYDFNFVAMKRKNNWVLYIKQSEMITNFMRVVHAFNSLIDFENIRINRDFRNQLNQCSNLDAYNQNKLAKANNNFQRMYKFLKIEKLEHLFNDKELIFFELKSHNHYSSLAELTTKYEAKMGIKKTRSGLNHYLYKLKKIYKDFN